MPRQGFNVDALTISIPSIRTIPKYFAPAIFGSGRFNRQVGGSRARVLSKIHPLWNNIRAPTFFVTYMSSIWLLILHSWKLYVSSLLLPSCFLHIPSSQSLALLFCRDHFRPIKRNQRLRPSKQFMEWSPTAFIATMSDQLNSSGPGPSTGRLFLIDDASVPNLNASLLYTNSLPVKQRYDRYLQILNDPLSSTKRDGRGNWCFCKHATFYSKENIKV